ncbi:MAG TPA: PAS domain-containing sensor histidine kinase [Thermoflexales bacterium]|nr:PAS domain-containing sensor histidine kinase [Thermoflexales bacterium]HQW36274.1 PAS domain-containing sensor histidine kinase [Thermoflexales bacterium]HQX76253.1 PAS domain-containing sensor histidine kinase [Thermoflexales bacterium]HQZ22098.1 PAS domain-containing sensor histidine kinase [Thermoflexales bacterium]
MSAKQKSGEHIMKLNHLKWLTIGLVMAYLITFEYIRHFVWPELLHQPVFYVASLAVFFFIIVGFNTVIFSMMARLQRDLIQKTAYLDLLVESSGNPIIATDKIGAITGWNKAAENIYGWPKDEALGKVLPMIPDPLRPQAHELIKRIWNGETISNMEMQRLRKDGVIIPVLVTASPIRDADGNIIGTVGVSTDLSDKKRLEQELQKQQQATAVLQERERMARELHDDLGQILGYVSTQSQAARALLADGHKNQADAYMKRLTEVAQDAHADVRDYILGLRTNISPERRLLPTLRGYVTRFGQNNDILASVETAPAAEMALLNPEMESQLLRIVQEALTNVRKHAAAKKVAVRVDMAGSDILIDVIDDGQGFDKARLANGDGRRFGQSIMRERAAEIGGTVTVKSAPGQGTHLTISAPIQHTVVLETA